MGACVLGCRETSVGIVGSLVRSLDPCTAFHHMQYNGAVDDHHKISVKISRGYILIGDNAITVIENWLDK